MADQINTIEIWQPRFSTSDVLVGTWHVKSGPNRIVFTKWKNKVLLMDGERMGTYPQTTNGSVGPTGHLNRFYQIPLKDFETEPSNQLNLLSGV